MQPIYQSNFKLIFNVIAKRQRVVLYPFYKNKLVSSQNV